MGLFNTFAYGDEELYGQAARLPFSVYPFKAQAINYNSALLTWNAPKTDGDSTVLALRVVRSSDGYPETAEDGKIILELSSDNFQSIVELLDDSVATGAFVYYRIWVLKSTSSWTLAGETFTLIPTRHASLAPDGTELVTPQNKLMDLLPRMFTSESLAPIDEVDTESDLYRFLDAFSFTLDILLTYGDLLLPPFDGTPTAPPAQLFLQALNLGLVPEAFLATKQQRRLIREAIYIYQTKGTLLGLEDLVESLTGFAPDITVSPNVVLTPQDSSFTNGIGFWQAIGDCSIEAVNNVVTPGYDNENYASDYSWVGKAVVGTVGSRISNGNDIPLTRGTPVKAGNTYYFSGWGRTESGTMGVTAYLSWYDKFGNLIRKDPPESYTQAPQSVTSSWSRYSFPGVKAPGVSRGIQSVVVANTDTPLGIKRLATFFFGEENTFVQGETVLLENTERIASEQAIPAVSYSVTDNVATVILPLGTTNPYSENDGVYLAGPGVSSIYVRHVVTAVSTGDESTPPTVSFEYFAENTGDPVDLTEGGTTTGLLIPLVNYDGAYVIYARNTNETPFISVEIPDADLTPTTGGEAPIPIPQPTTGLIVEAAPVYQTIPTTTIPLPYEISAVTVSTISDVKFVTITFAEEHGMIVGDKIVVQGVSPFIDFGVNELSLINSTTQVTYPWVYGPAFGGLTPDDGTVVPSSAFALKLTDDAVAAPKAVYAGYEFVFQNTGTVYLDMLQAAESPVANFHEARAAEIFLHPTKSNFIINPRFEPLVDGVNEDLSDTWAINETTTYQAQTYAFNSNESGLTGTGTVLKVTPADDDELSIVNDLGTIDGNSFYTFSVYAKTASGTQDVTLTLDVKTSETSPADVASKDKTITLTTSWQRFSVTLFVPEVSNGAGIIPIEATAQIAMSTEADAPTMYFDRPMVEGNFIATDFFDGDSPAYFGSTWESVDYESASHSYPNIDVKITRLKQELPKYVPINQPYLIQWHGGQFATPLT
jgi:phage tail-like protein